MRLVNILNETAVSHLYKGVKGLSIHLEELCFDVEHIDLGASHHDPDQHTICVPKP